MNLTLAQGASGVEWVPVLLGFMGLAWGLGIIAVICARKHASRRWAIGLGLACIGSVGGIYLLLWHTHDHDPEQTLLSLLRNPCMTGAHCVPLVLGAVAIAIVWWRRDTEPGRCPECGYDVHATLNAGRRECPECGSSLRGGDSAGATNECGPSADEQSREA